MNKPMIKAVPTRIAVFGASGHIGTPLARHMGYKAPHVNLRLISSTEGKCDGLKKTFPAAECVVANFFDLPSLERALDGVDGIFIVTPSPFDEATAMANFVSVAKRLDNLVHVVRIVGYEAESLLRRVPEGVRRSNGTAQQHHVAKAVLDESDLPVTYLNVGASFMDNFLLMAPMIRNERRMVWPDRLISYIDTRDLGEIAAELLLSSDGRHIHQFLTVNNGHDLLTTAEVVAMLSDVLKTPIAHEPTREAFLQTYGDMFAARRGIANGAQVAENIFNFIEYEQGNSTFLSLNDRGERLLGRKLTSVRAWFMEHRHHFAVPA